MQDEDLYLAKNARPAAIISALILPYAFPDAQGGLVNTYDLKQASDWGRGSPIYCHFRISTTFVGAAGNFARFFVAVDDNNLLSNIVAQHQLKLARGPDILTAGLVKDVEVTLVLPPLNTLVIPGFTDLGRQFLGVGYEANTPVSDWTQGGVDAWLSNIPRPVRNSSGYRSGY